MRIPGARWHAISPRVPIANTLELPQTPKVVLPNALYILLLTRERERVSDSCWQANRTTQLQHIHIHNHNTQSAVYMACVGHFRIFVPAYGTHRRSRCFYSVGRQAKSSGHSRGRRSLPLCFMKPTTSSSCASRYTGL